MLVLTRKKGERVLIGDDIVITLIDVRGDGVRIGFDAPRGVPIQRAEVLSAVTEANAEAAAASAATGDLLMGLLAKKPRAAQPRSAPAGAERAAQADHEPATAADPALTPRTPKPQAPNPRA